jgi:hypothetical protein
VSSDSDEKSRDHFGSFVVFLLAVAGFSFLLDVCNRSLS